MPRPPASQKAYTLIEVMMAATILLVSFAGVIQSVTMGAEMIDTARKQQIAQQIIDNEIGVLRLGSWNNIVTMANGTAYSITVNSDGTTTESPAPAIPSRFALSSNSNLILQAKGFTCQAGVIPPATATPTYLRPASATLSNVTFLSITYAVTWTSGAGRTHTRTGVAYFGQNGLHLSYQQ